MKTHDLCLFTMFILLGCGQGNTGILGLSSEEKSSIRQEISTINSNLRLNEINSKTVQQQIVSWQTACDDRFAGRSRSGKERGFTALELHER